MLEKFVRFVEKSEINVKDFLKLVEQSLKVCKNYSQKGITDFELIIL